MSQDRKAEPAFDSAIELLGRPLSARSVIASLLLGTTPPTLPGAALVRWCALFGIAAGTARVALHRMLARGELEAADGSYTLAGTLRERRRHQEWSLAPRLLPWHDEWDLRVVTAGARTAAQRHALRHSMARQRLAELREGVWLRPGNLPPEAAPADAVAVSAAQCTTMLARPGGDAADLASRLFEPRTWAARARLLAGRLEAVATALQGGELDRLADGFVTGAAGLAHVRADPLLPAPLRPEGYPGDELRASYLRYLGAYRTATARWFTTGRH